MQVRSARVISGKFDSIPDPRRPQRRVTVNAIVVAWSWRPDGGDVWRTERLTIPQGFSWNGASRPDFVGWLIPQWGVFSLASLIHDYCFVSRPILSDGARISRQHTDLLFLALMTSLTAERVDAGWKAPAQVVMAKVMYRAVRWFGEPVWDRHDKEYRA